MENENDLIRQIISGETGLFERIVIKYQNLVYTVCLNIVKNDHDAENTAQETFLSAYSSLSGFRGGNLKSWLCRIAVNKSVDFKRKQAEISALEEFVFHETLTGDPVYELAERKEKARRLNNILSGMPDKYRTATKAFYYDRLSVKEIARKTGLPEKTVETRLYRARKLIRERWGEDDI